MSTRSDQPEPAEVSAAESAAASLADAARTMASGADLPETLDAIVRAASTSLPAFEHVGISMTTKRGTVRTAAATSDVVTELDELQFGLEEGPCYDCVNGEPMVSAPRIRHDQRWPRYVPAAVQATGLQSQLAVRLHLDDGGTVGGLNLYSTAHEQVSEQDVAVAGLFATHAALALGGARTVADLHQAMESRRVIGVAVGLIMARYRIDEEAAFAFLARASSHANRKLRDIAAEMVHHANRDRDS